jgi:hypothetical protein
MWHFPRLHENPARLRMRFFHRCRLRSFCYILCCAWAQCNTAQCHHHHQPCGSPSVPLGFFKHDWPHGAQPTCPSSLPRFHPRSFHVQKSCKARSNRIQQSQTVSRAESNKKSRRAAQLGAVLSVATSMCPCTASVETKSTPLGQQRSTVAKQLCHNHGDTSPDTQVNW